MNSANRKDSGQFVNIIGRGVSMVAFSAQWCAPCRFQNPIIAQLVDRYDRKARIVGLDVETCRQSALGFGITSIPTTILFLDGKEIRRFIGLQPMEVLSAAIDNALEKSAPVCAKES